MTYQQTIKYLESFINYEKIPSYDYKESLKLERIKGFLSQIGNPQDYLKCIHIAGTKGKGSTSAFVAYILRAAGYKVGLYTSPHLEDFRERIRILKPGYRQQATGNRHYFDGMISKSELSQFVTKLKPRLEKYSKESKYGPLSFFEVYTALAFVYFKEKNVDFAVLETGMGGRLDATNVVNALISCITQISYDHMDKLGSTLKEIALEKAGIIKAKNKITPEIAQGSRLKAQGRIVISAPQVDAAENVIIKKCKETKSRPYFVGKDIKVRNINTKGLRLSFDVRSMRGYYKNLTINLLGKHQAINAGTAIAIVEALEFSGIIVDEKSIRKGLKSTIWPARFQIIKKNPLVILDIAHNTSSVRALKETLKENFQEKKIILILGISNDKDIKGICRELEPTAQRIILTKANNPRATEPEEIKKFIKAKEALVSPSVKDAVNSALELNAENDLILITGSVFPVAEAMSLLK